jgi:hypothetical protein
VKAGGQRRVVLLTRIAAADSSQPFRFTAFCKKRKDSNDMSEFPAEGGRPVWIASYPRSGNTFLRIILENSFHLPSYSVYYQEGDKHLDPSTEALEKAPRLPANWNELVSAGRGPLVPIKTHGPPSDDAPAIFIARDGRAAVDSYFHYHKKFAFEQPSLTEMIAGVCQFGSWSEHYWTWRPKTRPNTLLLRYEELVTKPEVIIAQVADFLKLKPDAASLPNFAELQKRSPKFFRRGQNTDYLSEWTASQMSLFNRLHASAMQDLGFPLAPSTERADEAVLELAQSAARLHRVYLEQLANVARSIENHQEDVQRYSRLVEEMSAAIERVLKPMLQSRWVRLGMALNILPNVRTDELPAVKPRAKAPRVEGRDPVRPSGENTQSSSLSLQTNPPSVPSGGISARG